MAHQTLTRASLVAWGTGAVTDAEFRSLDLKGFQSINGDEGGVWAPSSVIEIGGQGLLVSGPFMASGASTFTGPSIFSDDVVFDENVALNGDTTIGTSSADDLTVVATATFRRESIFIEDVTIGSSASDDFVVVANAEFQAPAIFSDDVTLGNDSGDVIDINGSVNLDAPVTFDSAATILGVPTLGVHLRYTGIGRVPRRTGTLQADANETISVSDGQLFKIPTGTSTTRTCTLSTSGASSGDEIEFFTGFGNANRPAFDYFIDVGTAQNAQFNTTGSTQHLIYVFYNSAWWLKDYNPH